MSSIAPAPRSVSGHIYGILLVAGLALIFFTFWSGLVEMERVWAEPEYSYAYLIPFLSVYVLLLRLPVLNATVISESWLGVLVMAVGLLAYVFGELSALYIIVQYAFLLTVWGFVHSVIGLRGVRVIWAALLFLIFLVPLPRFLQFSLSSGLQFVSSELGAGFLELVGVTVFLEGNVIDLGTYKLQVVEACSGLRYLFPLMSFGFLCAVLFRGPIWQRWLIFLSSVPISVVMNSFRIAVTGMLVSRFGTEAADGFLHYFEGWVIFAACLLLMFAEMAALAALGGRRLDDIFNLDLPRVEDFRGLGGTRTVGRPLVFAAAILVAGTLATVSVSDREEIIPAGVSLRTFPLTIGDWYGQERTISDLELDNLKLTDYTMVSYQNPTDPGLIELYVAYYESQRKGTSAHSPRACLPGSGWVFDEFGQANIPDIMPDGGPLAVNRVLVSMGERRLLVYYWFMQRGRTVTNEYMVKWYIFWDSITKHRTDGAMVRVVAPIADVSEVPAAEARVGEFLKKAYPALYYHIPQVDAVAVSASRTDLLNPAPTGR
ncbi:MAG: VPLPA-CTERM-specific exosortase XrtD [Gammaproteobacteria bacterium]|nr:VPLPA-CTERM-specific exosortase XrtD [Gammaproteobacteria bacterium]